MFIRRGAPASIERHTLLIERLANGRSIARDTAPCGAGSARLKSIVNLVTINETFPCVVDLHDHVLLFLIAQ
jgi:hypothetical protein